MRHQHINKCHLKKLSAEKVLWYENVKKNYFKYYTELFYQSHFPLNQELPRRSRLFFLITKTINIPLGYHLVLEGSTQWWFKLH